MLSNGSVLTFLLISSISFITIEGNKRYHIPSIRSNWFKANEFCNSLKMRLVVIKSQEENDAVAKFAQSSDKFSENKCLFWIGGTDLADESNFIWVSTGEGISYKNWKRGEPNNRENEDCIQLAYIPEDDYYWHWNDNDCDKAFYFICESIDCDCVQQF